jgi:hypothetical protein
MLQRFQQMQGGPQGRQPQKQLGGSMQQNPMQQQALQALQQAGQPMQGGGQFSQIAGILGGGGGGGQPMQGGQPPIDQQQIQRMQQMMNTVSQQGQGALQGGQPMGTAYQQQPQQGGQLGGQPMQGLQYMGDKSGQEYERFLDQQSDIQQKNPMQNAYGALQQAAPLAAQLGGQQLGGAPQQGQQNAGMGSQLAGAIGMAMGGPVGMAPPNPYSQQVGQEDPRMQAMRRMQMMNLGG